MAFGLGSLISGAVGLIGGGIQLLTGNSQRRQANRLEASNVLPRAEINPYILQNLAFANQRAAQGLPAEQYNLALQNIGRNQASVLRQFQRGGASTSLASILRGTNDATLQLDATNAQARQQNQLYADQARLTAAQEQQRVWEWNEAQPYLRNLERIGQLRQSGNQNFFGGLGTILNTGLNVGSQLFSQQLFGSQMPQQRIPQQIGTVTPTQFNYIPSSYIPLPR